MADNREELQKTMLEWHNTFRKRGLSMNLEKTEMMWIGEQNVNLLQIGIKGKMIRRRGRYMGHNVEETIKGKVLEACVV